MTNSARIAIWLVTICAALALAWVTRTALLVIILAMAYAFLTWPLTRVLTLHLPRPLAAIFANAGLAALVAALLAALGPLIYVQSRSLANQLPGAVTVMLQGTPAMLRSEFTQLIAKVDGNVLSLSREALQTSIGAFRSVTGVIGAAILIPVLATYFQIDLPRYERTALNLIPTRYHAATRQVTSELSSVMGSFVRAQMLVSGIVGTLVYVVLLVTQVHFAGTIAFFTAIADSIPYLGGIAAFVPSVLLALAFGGVGKGVIVTLLLIAVFTLEAQILQPQIVGSRTALPPSVVVMSLVLGGTLAGVIGLYLAVPIAFAIRIITRHLLESPKSSRSTTVIAATTRASGGKTDE